MLSCRAVRVVRGLCANWTLAERFAGHSKWQNIRHTKSAKDTERSVLYNKKLKDIRVALLGNGWITDPAKSPALARAIDEALRANVPKETVENYFKKLQGAKETLIEYRLRGPNDCILIVNYSATASGVSYLRYQVKKILFGSSVLSVTTGFNQAFEKKGIIVARHLGEESSMDDAEEAAIIGGAEEVRPEEEKNVYRFLTEAQSLWAVTKHLRTGNWQIEEAGIEDLPTYLVEVPETDLQEVVKIVNKLQEIPEYIKIVDNIA